MDFRPPLPREHGAWAQIAIASGAAVMLAHAHPMGFWAWLVALWLAFIAHEALLLVLGQRGVKARQSQGRRAWMWMATLLGLAAWMGWLGWENAGPGTRWATALPMGLALLLIPGTIRGEEKTLAGELLAALALGGAALPLVLRAGMAWTLAWHLAGGLMLAFALATLLVRRFLATMRKRPEPITAVGAVVLMGLSAVLGMGLMMDGKILAGISLLPLPLLGLRLLAAPWPPHRLKQLGWMLAFGNIATALLLVAALR